LPSDRQLLAVSCPIDTEKTSRSNGS